MVMVALHTLLNCASNTRCDREPNNPIPGVNPKRRDRPSSAVGSASPWEDLRETRQQQQDCVSEDISGFFLVIFFFFSKLSTTAQVSSYYLQLSLLSPGTEHRDTDSENFEMAG